MGSRPGLGLQLMHQPYVLEYVAFLQRRVDSPFRQKFTDNINWEMHSRSV